MRITAIDINHTTLKAKMVKRTFSFSTFFLLLFALSFTYFAIQSGDVLMYLALARDFLLKGEWPTHDPYLYSLPQAQLHIAHEYLSYLLFYGAWFAAGYAGLILFKVALYLVLFSCVLYAQPHTRNASALWMALWILAVLAGSFRFIERSSLFSDLFCVFLVATLVDTHRITRGLIAKLTVLFFFWIQLHPGFPMGLMLLAVWVLWNALYTPEFVKRKLFWLLLPVVILFLNPLGAEGVFYPIHFAFNEAQVLRLHNLEWFAPFHPVFRTTPETLAFWILSVAALGLLWRERAWLTLRGVFIFVTFACALQAVRFVPWVSFAFLILLKPWAQFRSPRLAQRYLAPFLILVMVLVTVKNLTQGYVSSSGPRVPKLALDTGIFPIETLKFLRKQPLSGRLYNTHDFGSYLIWEGYIPIFHHGFVTDMDFYENDVAAVFASQQRFLELGSKYGWTMLLVDKHGSYPYFYKILSPLPDWKIVAEDDASYLIYLMPQTKVPQ